MNADYDSVWAWLMNLMQLFAFGFCFLCTLRIVAWHFLPYSSDVFAHELCVFMIYVCTQVVLGPLPPVPSLHPRHLCNALPPPSQVQLSLASAWSGSALFGFRFGNLLRCCRLFARPLSVLPAAKQPGTLLLMTFAL